MSYTPWMGRKFGVEMEMRESSRSGNRHNTTTVARLLTSAGVANVRDTGAYVHSNGRTWDCKIDGSCGLEIASPALTFDANGHNEQLRKACDALSAAQMKVDESCGLHIHVEVADFNWRDLQKLLALWVRYEPFFFGMLPTSRLNNTYCQPLRGSRWSASLANAATRTQQLIMMDDERAFVRECSNAMSDKYKSLNLNHYWHSQRLEFRLHSGTVDYTKIRNWTILLLALVGRVKAENAPPLARKINQPKPEIGFRPEHIVKMLGLDETTWTQDSEVAREVRAWAVARYAHFAARR